MITSRSETSSFRYSIWNTREAPAPPTIHADCSAPAGGSGMQVSTCTGNLGDTRNEHRTW